jgi:hypothetical protein
VLTSELQQLDHSPGPGHSLPGPVVPGHSGAEYALVRTWTRPSPSIRAKPTSTRSKPSLGMGSHQLGHAIGQENWHWRSTTAILLKFSTRGSVWIEVRWDAVQASSLEVKHWQGELSELPWV